MRYHHLDPDDVDPMPDRPCETRDLSAAADLDRLGLRSYRPEPGEQLPLAYHYHEEQEEAFYVAAGSLRVETPDGEWDVDAGEVFVVHPGNPHRAHVPEGADGPARVVAVGAPRVDDAREA